MENTHFISSSYLERFDMPAELTVENRPPIVFLHGAYSGAWCWQPYFQPAFSAQGWNSTSFSLEAHAGSEGEAWRTFLGIQDYVKNLQTIVESLPAKPVIIAHSMGGFILYEYLKQGLPAAGAVFLAPVPPEGLSRSIMPMMSHAPNIWLTLNLFQLTGLIKPSVQQIKSMLFSRDTKNEDIAQWVDLFHPESMRALVDLNLTLPPRAPQSLDIPTLVLNAQYDRVIGESLVESCAKHYGVTMQTIPNCGHMMMLDQAHPKVLKKIFAWLNKHFPADKNALNDEQKTKPTQNLAEQKPEQTSTPTTFASTQPKEQKNNTKMQKPHKKNNRKK